MNETITNEALDLIVFADDCKCEVPHRLTPCTYDVVARYSDCETKDRKILICAGFMNVAAVYLEKMTPLTVCADCGRPAKDCWKVTPV